MKKLRVFRSVNKMLPFLMSIFLVGLNSIANNPKNSNYLINLSSSVNSEAVNDVVPEMIIQGNTIHVVWTEDKYGVPNPLYYCRSIDLGKTWETPRLIANIKSNEYAKQPNSRKLSVDGQNVHIAFCDYDYYDGMSGRIFYFRSVNGGISFEEGKELVKCSKIYGSQIKAARGKVGIAYLGSSSKNGLRMLASTDGGSAFTENLISEEPNGLSDFWFDGTQMIVVSEYSYYYFGLNVGNVFVSISNNNGTTFTTQKVSSTYNESATVVREKCRCYFDGHYAPKIAKSGNSIHVVFVGYNEKIEWTTLYARSTDNGLTFEKAKDINNAILPGNALQTGMESIVAKNGHVYMVYQSTAGKIYFLQSSDYGSTYSTAVSILPEGFSYTDGTWWPSLILDPNDATGSNVYLAGQSMFSAKSTNGGKTFTEYTLATPFMNRSIRNMTSDLAIDSKGNKHWISEALYKGGSDIDIFYRSIISQPSAGTTDKACSIETDRPTEKYETLIVPSSPTIDFDSSMTAEVWVKFDPKSEEGMNIFCKMTGWDGYDYAPNGYQMGFRKADGKYYVNAGLETDKGDFVNWGGSQGGGGYDNLKGGIADTLWHHFAFTYDAKAGLNNFKTYVDGLLNVQQTVTGKLTQGEGILMIGSRQLYNGSTKYQIDNIRFWDRALTQDELLENQVKTLSGKEKGLKLFLNFDDTFKDISGNGNDAIPLYLGVLKPTNFNPPVPEFEIYQNLNQISLSNKTKNGTSFSWNFGDGNLSDKGNPVNTYASSGEYMVTMVAANANSKTATLKKTSIAGLNRVEPLLAGNGGYATLTVFGGGLTVDQTTVILRKSGEADIQGEKLTMPVTGSLSAFFNLSGHKIGKWDFVMKKNGVEQILKEAFEIVKATEPNPWVNVSGRGRILFSTWQTYTINYGNNGNVDALGVPLFLAIQNYPETDVELIDFRIKPNTYIRTKFPTIVAERKLDYFIWKDYFGSGKDARIYSFVIPIIPSNGSESVHVRIKSPDTFMMESWMNAPLYNTLPQGTKSAALATDDWPDQSTKLNACVAAAAMDAASSGAADLIGMVLPIGCAYDVFTFAWNPWDAISPKPNEPRSWTDYLYGASSAIISCGASFTGVESVLKAGMLVKTMMEGYQKNFDCHKLFDPLYKDKKSIFAVFSFDPNEMIGPSGYSDKQWIQKNNTVPYTILFENKSTASAPAHTVSVTDSLDLAKFDLKDFGFGAFGFGDTTLVPLGKKLKEFSMDINLQPKMDLITRVSGKLDTISGVIKWEFISLNPNSLLLEEDPLIGFLPPNNAIKAGEGFVSFSVGLKKELKTNATLKNMASIVFDANKPILTNEYLNTLDMDKPQSQVYPLSTTIESRFPVSWTGSDLGSGVATYSVFVLENDTALHAWKLNTDLKSDEFIGNVGSKYKFYSIATDNASLTEDAPADYDASTQIIVHVDEFDMKKDAVQVFPNPAKEKLTILFPNAPCGIYIVEFVGINGQVFYSKIHDDFSLATGIQLNINGYPPGQYLLRMVYGNRTVSQKVQVK